MILLPQMMAPAQSAQSLITSGLVCRLELNEGSGGTAYDSSGSGNNAVVTGSPTWGSGSITLGPGQYLTVNSSLFSGSAFTLFIHCTINSLIGYDALLCRDYPEVDIRKFQFRKNSDKLELIRFDSSLAVIEAVLSSPIVTGTHRIAASFSTSSGSLIYMNGAQIGSSTNTTAGVAPDLVRVGYLETKTLCYLNNTAYEVRVYNQALSPSDMAALTSGAG